MTLILLKDSVKHVEVGLKLPILKVMSPITTAMVPLMY